MNACECEREKDVVASRISQLRIRRHVVLKFMQSESVKYFNFGTCVKPINMCSLVDYDISYCHFF